MKYNNRRTAQVVLLPLENTVYLLKSAQSFIQRKHTHTLTRTQDTWWGAWGTYRKCFHFSNQPRCRRHKGRESWWSNRTRNQMRKHKLVSSSLDRRRSRCLRLNVRTIIQSLCTEKNVQKRIVSSIVHFCIKRHRTAKNPTNRNRLIK